MGTKFLPVGKLVTFITDLEGKMNDCLFRAFSDGPGVTEVEYCSEIEETGPTLLQSANGTARRTAQRVVVLGAEQIGVQQAKELGAKAAASKASGIMAKQVGAAV